MELAVKTMQLQDFIHSIERDSPEEVFRIEPEVPIEYVIPEMGLELERRREYPILFFENVAGFDMPVITNLLATRERIAKAVNIELGEFYDIWNQRLHASGTVETRRTGPVKDITITGDEVNLNEQIPALKHFIDDAGRYITAALVVARHPETGVYNMAFARTLLKEPDKAGLSAHSRGDLWEYLKVAEERGEELDIAMIPGCHPSLFIATSASPSIDVDEYELLGAIRDEPLEVVPAETVELHVPADAEIVIEGRIDPTEREPEGPFGEYTGFMSGRSTENVFRISAITRRENPTYVSIMPGKSAEHLLLGAVPKEPFIFDRIKQENPYIEDIALPLSGVYYNCVISIDKSNAAQPRQTILSAFGAWRYLKHVIVVDDDIDIHDEREVLWAIATTVQAQEDVIIIPDAVGNQLDPSSHDGITDKMGIDATKPIDGQYLPCEVPDEAARVARELIDERSRRAPITTADD